MLLQAWSPTHQTGTLWFFICSADVLHTYRMLSDMVLCILPGEHSSMILCITCLNQKL